MSGFDKVELKWKGQSYTIESNRVLRLIARIEEVVTIDELVKYAARQTAPMAKLAMAYGAALRYAGVEVTDEEVFESIFVSNSGASITAAITGLLSLMIPKSAQAQAAKTSEVNAVGKSKRAHAGSSKKHTKPSSASSASSLPSSSGG